MFFKIDCENELVKDFTNGVISANNDWKIDADDIIQFMKCKENFKFFTPVVLELLFNEFGNCELTKWFALRTWIYQNYIKRGIRNISYSVVNSTFFKVENIDEYDKYYDAIKDVFSVSMWYYDDGLENIAGKYNYNKIVDIVYELIDHKQFIDDVKLRLNEKELLKKFELN